MYRGCESQSFPPQQLASWPVETQPSRSLGTTSTEVALRHAPRECRTDSDSRPPPRSRCRATTPLPPSPHGDSESDRCDQPLGHGIGCAEAAGPGSQRADLLALADETDTEENIGVRPKHK